MLIKAFWALAVLDAIGLLVMLVAGLRAKGPQDGSIGMGLLFYVLIPGLALLVSAFVFAFVPWTAVRWICLAVVAAPLSFYAYVAAAQVGLTFINDPAKAHANPPMQKLVRAVTKLDVDGVRQWAPQMDKDINQGDPNAPLRLVIDSMLKEIQTRLPARVEPHLAIVKILLDNGAKPNEVLEWACFTKSGELMTLLFQGGADPNFKTTYGGPVFFSAISSQTVVGSVLPMVQAFFSAGVDVNAVGNIGERPLEFAIGCKKLDAALYLLDHGAILDPGNPSVLSEIQSELNKIGPDATPEEQALAGRLRQRLKVR